MLSMLLIEYEIGTNAVYEKYITGNYVVINETI